MRTCTASAPALAPLQNDACQADSACATCTSSFSNTTAQYNGTCGVASTRAWFGSTLLTNATCKTAAASPGLLGSLLDCMAKNNLNQCYQNQMYNNCVQEVMTSSSTVARVSVAAVCACSRVQTWLLAAGHCQYITSETDVIYLQLLFFSRRPTATPTPTTRAPPACKRMESTPTSLPQS